MTGKEERRRARGPRNARKSEVKCLGITFWIPAFVDFTENQPSICRSDKSIDASYVIRAPWNAVRSPLEIAVPRRAAGRTDSDSLPRSRKPAVAAAAAARAVAGLAS
ncbi:hypothetical protein LIA77_02919 [Sarocladium implicatum]|nr:hypothetical protein LIA77_02919 [Sarocladium implicatum]